MSCYHPLRGFVLGEKNNGKKELKISSSAIDYWYENKNGSLIPCRNGEPAPLDAVKEYHHYIDIPCYRCIGCRIDRRRSWSDRLALELPYHESAWFLTLTYDDDNLHKRDYVDLDGVIQESHTLDKRDLQLFWKSLRNDGQKIMYYAAGEYGPKTKRPHYHAIVFDLKLDDLKVYTRTNNCTYYKSDYLNSRWKNGFVVVGEVEYNSISYVAGYVEKKLLGDAAKEYEYRNVEPETSFMSKKPAIGLKYFEENIDKILDDNVYVKGDHPHKVALPLYYKRKLEDLDIHKSILEELRKAGYKDTKSDIMHKNITAYTDQSYLDQLEIIERNVIAEQRNKRNKI